MWRPAPMQWLDIMVNRESAGQVLDALAESRTLEVVTHPREQHCTVAEESLERLHSLEERLKPFLECLPEVDLKSLSAEELSAPMELNLPPMEQAIERWLAEAAGWCEQIRGLEEVLEEWQLLARCLRQLPDDGIDLGSFHQGKAYRAMLGVGPAEALLDLPQHEGEELVRSYPVIEVEQDRPDEQLQVVLGLAHIDRLQPLERQLRSGGMRFLGVPSVLRGPPSVAQRALQQLIVGRERDRLQFRRRVDRIAAETRLGAWRWQLRRYLWFSGVMQQTWCNDRFLWICGWCPGPQRPHLEAALRNTGASYLIRTEDPGGHGTPPVMLNNPNWMRQFEVFVRSYGVPQQNQIDPTPLLAVVTPLLFGYMFGDVGQGAVLLLGGFLLQRRLPLFRLLIPAGASAILFGLIFGSVFCVEHWIPALWLHPMEQPIRVLAVPMVFGALLLLGSIALAAIQARWGGSLRQWAGEQLPLVFLVFGLMALLMEQSSTILFFTGAVLLALFFRPSGGVIASSVKSLLLLLENSFQLLINILSFVRVGAFALAHAGLGTAVLALAQIPQSAVLQLAIMVLGNLLVIGLEGLVVSIQTARLVMFEFFRRFLEGYGRAFNPLQPPAVR